ncbi:MAG: hypothetical protein NTY46_04465 [Candidatus Sumerlaeota bacterium]|nr:hypothetical protein [Candidatus Sumerlaeota bacterium]
MSELLISPGDFCGNLGAFFNYLVENAIKAGDDRQLMQQRMICANDRDIIIKMTTSKRLLS